MDLALSESEDLIAGAVRRFVDRDATREALVEISEGDSPSRPDWHAKMADAGWLAMLVPEAFGGGGATYLETAMVAEELGRGPVPGPWLMSSVVAAGMLRAARPSDARSSLFEGIASGAAVVVPLLRLRGAAGDDVVPASVTAEVAGPQLVLRGSVPFVPSAGTATHLLVAIGRADDGAHRLAVVRSDADGVRTRRLHGFLAWNDVVEFDGCTIAPADVIELPEWHIDSASIYPALALTAAYQVGGCRELLERSIRYSNERVQFGQPIGRFQRVQDHIVRLLNACDTARWTTYEALWRLDAGRPAGVSVHLAKALATDGYYEAANAAHEVHAGIGSDPKFGLSLFSQMSRTLHDFLGSPRAHRRAMMNHLEQED
ncbi:MAG: acyl-CoA dehydrogenase family protein [Acidimicrobiales bacterium]